MEPDAKGNLYVFWKMLKYRFGNIQNRTLNLIETLIKSIYIAHTHTQNKEQLLINIYIYIEIYIYIYVYIYISE